MCGRYYIEESPELRPIIEAMNHSPLVAKFQKSSAVLSQGEIRPTNVAPVIASSKSGNRAVFPMKWGFTGKTLLINAKTETAAFKPTFREAWASHRWQPITTGSISMGLWSFQGSSDPRWNYVGTGNCDPRP